MIAQCALLTTFLFIAGAIEASPVYRHVDSEGRVSYTDKPKHKGYVRLEQTWKGWQPAPKFGNFKRNLQRYRPLVVQNAKRNELPAELVKAVIHAESHFNPSAISSAGAVGLMQLMPATATRYGVHDRWDPVQNVRGGTRYLSDLMAMFDDELELALAAYNAGENAVLRYDRSIPPFPETQNYVKKVKMLYQRYVEGMY